jgi:hypothetical protein
MSIDAPPRVLGVRVRTAGTAAEALRRVAARLDALRAEEERLLAVRAVVIDIGKRDGLTQKAAAEALDVTEPTINKILRGAGLAPEPTPRPRKRKRPASRPALEAEAS